MHPAMFMHWFMNPFQMPDVNMFRKIVEQQKNLHFRHKNISMLNLFFFIWPLKDMLFAKR